MYRPRFGYIEPNINANKVAYGQKSLWSDLGKQQNLTVKKEQFEHQSKLCMHILKALDQEQVDIKNNKRLRLDINHAKIRETSLQRQLIRSSTVNAEKNKKQMEESGEHHHTTRNSDKPKEIAFMSSDIYNSVQIKTLKKDANLQHYYTSNPKNMQFQFSNQ